MIFFSPQGKEEKKPEKPAVMNPKKVYNIGQQQAVSSLFFCPVFFLLLFLSLNVVFSDSCLCSQVFIYSKRTAILLGHLKIPFEEIKQALLAMDEKKFTESHLKQLLLYAPDKEEVRKTENQPKEL